MNDDQTLAQTATDADSPFGDPAAPSTPPPGRRQWTIDEILTKAKRPEKYATICLRADLQAQHDRIVGELAALVTPAGDLVDPDADDAPLGEESAAGKVERLNRDLAAVRAQMQDAMWFPLFRALPSDELTVFNEQHYPKKDGASLVPFYNKLIAASAIEPQLTVADVEKLRTTLGARAIAKLVETAMEVNTKGGLDIPFSPTFYRPPTQQSPAAS